MSFVVIVDPIDAEHVIHVQAPLSPRALNFMAAGMAAAISSSMYNPLDCLKVRWQVRSSTLGSSEGSLVSFGYNIVKREGLMNGLWKPGVGAQAWGMGLSSGIRFACYEPFRNALVGEHGEKSHGHMVLAGLSAGCIGYIITTPFHLLKTTMQAQLESPQRRPYVHDFMTGMQQIVQKQGFASLYRGAIPLSSRGALFTAGQLVGYDGCKTMARDAGYKDNAYLHVASAVSASFWASFLSAPADLVMAKYMSSQNSLSSSIREIYIQHGVVGFWRGWMVFLVRLTPSLLTYSTLYEQLRHNLGLGYFE